MEPGLLLRELPSGVNDVTAVYEVIGKCGRGLSMDLEREGKLTSSL